MKKIYHPGKIKPIVQVVARILEKDPSLHADHERLFSTVYENIPALQDRAYCANCSASMVQYEYNIDILDIALTIGMGNAVRKHREEGKDFTEANKVHVPTLAVSDAVRHRTTKCSKLGLVAKNKKAGRQEKGMWVVTERGFKALRGEEIPTGTIVWRGQIIDRPETVTTFEVVRNFYIKRVQEYEYRHRKVPKDDHREEMGTYNPLDWVDFAGYHEGNLF